MMRPTLPHRQAGFSLIEMAVVLFIIVLLLGSLLVPFATQVEQRRIAETQKAMEEAREALIGFALSNAATDGRPRLPCPDNNNDGIAETPDPVTHLCPGGNGLPWVTLGVAGADAWGNRFRYYLAPYYGRDNLGFTMGPPPTSASGRVCSASGCVSGTVMARNLPAIIMSAGPNGHGAINSNRGAGDMTTIPCPSPSCSKDELENLDGNADFVSRIATTTPNEFDDIVVWVSPNILFNRLVAAQRLP